MALPSQSARPIKIRGSVAGRRRRRRGGGGFVVGVILVGAAGGATWWLWPEASEEPTAIGPVADTAGDSAPSTTDTPAIVTPGVEVRDAAEVDSPVVTDASATDTAAIPDVASPPIEPTPPDTGPSVLDHAAILVRERRPVEARALLSVALRDGTLSPSDADHVRATLSAINEGLVFSDDLANGDPHVDLYTIKSGDSLTRIVDDQNLPINWRFLQRLNGIRDHNKIGVGQRLKTIVSPFHAEVFKDDHRLDLWLGEGDKAVYVRSFKVGLGEFDSTPLGVFRVRLDGKLVNPAWRNPRTGESFDRDDPKNPIGEYWIGLEGIESHNLQEQGFGVHGTIDPDSIGHSESMGCVRLGDDDIALLFELLASGQSTVTVQ